MMLIIKSIENNNTPVLKLDGRFDGIGANILDEEVIKLGDIKYLILDFTNVNYLSSAGIRILLKTEKQLRSVKGKMFIVNLPQPIAQILRITGLLEGFSICGSIPEAISAIDSINLQDLNSSIHKIKDRTYSVKEYRQNQSKFRIWGNLRLSDKNIEQNKLILSTLDELNFSFASGAAAIDRKEAAENIGDIITTKNFFGISCGQDRCISDFIFSKQPDETFLYLSSAVSIEGKPALLVETDSINLVTIKTLIEDTLNILSSKNNNCALFGFVIIAETDLPNAKGIFSVGTAIDRLGFESSPDKQQLKLVKDLIDSENELMFYSNKALLNNVNMVSENEDPDEAVNTILKEENIADTSLPDNEIKVGKAKIWLYLPSEINDAENGRLQIGFENDFEVSDEHELIIRKIYSDCSRITLKQLQGGFTAKTFQVFGYDKNGIRILPTVLKLGSAECIKREAEHSVEFVSKYILNNSTSIMGSYFHNNSGGVRYNFVGINGPDSKLKWLTHHYIEKQAEEIIPLFDKIFTNIFKPWYGQPKLEIIMPYKEHNPILSFFPGIFDDCKKELGINADAERIYFEELNREIVNPYWFLKYEYKRRENYSKLWYKCISHGDLNMQNILLDELNNIYMIDFSETQFRNAVSDFARLEPIVKFEIPALDNDDILRNMAEFEQGLLSINRLDEIPGFTYKGNDPSVDKAYKIICRLRQYANTVTLFETDLVPYLLAVLEWTYPVVSYYGVDTRRKKLSAISAALTCEKIIALETK